MSRSFEEMLYEFQNELVETYGLNMEDAIVKIGIKPELFQKIVIETANRSYRNNLSPLLGRSLNLNGIIIVPKNKEIF